MLLKSLTNWWANTGSIAVGALIILSAVSLVGVTACPPVNREPTIPPPPAGCTQGETACHEGAPWRCGPEGAWARADRRCDALGAVCCRTQSAVAVRFIHACVTPDRCEVASANP